MLSIASALLVVCVH